MKINKSVLIGLVIGFVCIVVWYYYVIFLYTKSDVAQFNFEINTGESAYDVGQKLYADGVISSPFTFRLYLKITKKDRDLKTGNYSVSAPLTIARIVSSLSLPNVQEKTITIIPGWTLRDLADYFLKEGIIENKEELFLITGFPVEYSEVGFENTDDYNFLSDKPKNVSLEGYLRPDTFRIYKDASVEEIVKRLLDEREKQIPKEWYDEVKKQGRSMHEIFTMASILQKEVRGMDNKKMAADLFWRRLDKNWAMQSDATVHYIFGTPNSVFTTDMERSSLNPYNTYKYPGLPPGPISFPSLESIEAALYPAKNDYWYFLTTLDTGEVIFSKTIDEHTNNVYKYLR